MLFCALRPSVRRLVLLTCPNKTRHCFCCHPETTRISTRNWHLAEFLEGTQVSGVGVRLYRHFKRFKNHWSHQLRLESETEDFGSWCEQMESIFQHYRWVASFPLGWGACWFFTKDKSDHVLKQAEHHQDFPCNRKNALAALAALVHNSMGGTPTITRFSSHLFIFNWWDLCFGIFPGFKSWS